MVKGDGKVLEMRWLVFGALLLFLILSVRKGLEIYEGFRRVKFRVVEKGQTLGIKWRSTDGEGNLWELKASSGRLEGNRLYLDNVSVAFTSKDGRRAVIGGKKGVYDKGTEVGVVEGNVRIFVSNSTIYTNRLIWYKSERKVCVPENFVLKGRYEVWGRDMCLFPDREEVVVSRLKRVVMK